MTLKFEVRKIRIRMTWLGKSSEGLALSRFTIDFNLPEFFSICLIPLIWTYLLLRMNYWNVIKLLSVNHSCSLQSLARLTTIFASLSCRYVVNLSIQIASAYRCVHLSTIFGVDRVCYCCFCNVPTVMFCHTKLNSILR